MTCRESPSWAIVLLGAGIILGFFLVFPHHGIAAWPALLLVASVLLLSYREPAGAFGVTHSIAITLPQVR